MTRHTAKDPGPHRRNRGALCPVFLALVLLALPAAVAAGAPAETGIHAGPVAGMAGDLAITLEIAPRPVAAMRDLAFVVGAPGFTGPEIRVDLGMPGMAMPPNRVILRRGEDGLYRGTGLVVRCRSGRRTWTATVTVPGKPPVPFTFDVAD